VGPVLVAQLQADIAADPIVVLAQQVGGANIGSMVCARSISRTVLPMLVYVAGFAVAGFALVQLV
jgi:hypothetical protein